MEHAPLPLLATHPKPKSTSALLGRFQTDRSSRRPRHHLLMFGRAHRHHSMSAVHDRNDQFQADDWEVQAAPRSLLSRALNTANHPTVVVPLVHTQNHSRVGSTSSLTTTPRPTTTPAHDYSITTKETKTKKSRGPSSVVVASIIQEQRKREQQQMQHHAAMCQDGLDCRLSSDHVADMLDLGDYDAQLVLNRLRGRCGAVEMEEPQTVVSSRTVPYVHVLEDVWIPHYEEYVVRSVEAFTQFLRKPSLSSSSSLSRK